ncbi:hypothetical protein ACHAWF_010729 [Thalassiosira exigua]
MTSVDLCRPSTADDPMDSADGGDATTSDSLRKSFLSDGFVVFHRAISLSLVGTLQSRLERVLRGEFNRGSPPDKMPKHVAGSKEDGVAPLGYDGSSRSSRVVQIINIHKCDRDFRQLATSPEIGRMVAELAGWEHGARLAQDQVWAKPPGAPPLVFHRDSPYFMFEPPDVVTVWIALDDMDENLGPLEYARRSHRWGQGRVGSASSFFQLDNRQLLYSAARLEGIEDPESNLEIVSMGGLKAGGISIHHGRTWHGSGQNRTSDRPRRGLGLHFVPANAIFTEDSRKSKLWRDYILDVAYENLMHSELPDEHFPLVWNGSR